MVTRKEVGLPKPKSNSSAKQTPGNGNSNYTPIRWVSYTFTAEQKRVIKETELDVERFFDTLASLVESGHKFTISPENSAGFIGASLFGYGEQCPNKGYGVSGEGGNLYAAIKSLAWKLEFLQYNLAVPTIDSEDDFR